MTGAFCCDCAILYGVVFPVTTCGELLTDEGCCDVEFPTIVAVGAEAARVAVEESAAF
jgi:hypothetical protein